MERKRMARGTKSTLTTLLMVLAVSIVGCGKPKYPRAKTPTLYTTISADGRMVAALDHAGTEQPRLRVIRLDTDKAWRDLLVPPYTTSVHFGLNDHELLLTRHVGDGDSSDLLKWDLEDLTKPMEIIYRAYGLGFPLEISPGEYLIRECITEKDSLGLCSRSLGNRWSLVTRDGVIDTYTRPIGIGGHRQPNLISKKGLFWRNAIDIKSPSMGSDGKRDEHPHFLIVPFAGTSFPDLERLKIDDPSTTELRCDFLAERCLRSFVSHKDQDRLFVYDREIIYKNTRCHPEGLQGFSDGSSITPDGNAAVMPLASRYDRARHVVVMIFKPDQCEPISIQHIQF